MRRFCRSAALHHIHHSPAGLFDRRGDGHALAKGQSIRFDDDGGLLRVQIGESRFHLIKNLALCRGNPIFLHQVFGEDFAGLHLRGTRVRPKCRDPRRLQRIHAAKRKRIIRRHTDKVHLFFAGKFHNGLHIRRLYLRHAACNLRNARVSRRTQKLRDKRGLLQLAAYGMLAAAAANDEYLHTE